MMEEPSTILKRSHLRESEQMLATYQLLKQIPGASFQVYKLPAHLSVNTRFREV